MLLLVTAFTALPQTRRPAPRAPVINENTLRAHIKYLSDDLMEGRGPGARGGELAAKYIAAQLEALGFAGRPAGTFTACLVGSSDRDEGSLGQDESARPLSSRKSCGLYGRTAQDVSGDATAFS